MSDEQTRKIDAALSTSTTGITLSDGVRASILALAAGGDAQVRQNTIAAARREFYKYLQQPGVWLKSTDQKTGDPVFFAMQKSSTGNKLWATVKGVPAPMPATASLTAGVGAEGPGKTFEYDGKV